MDLNIVRELRGRIVELERRLEMLRLTAESIRRPVLDGVPRSRSGKSPVEQITVKICAAEEEVAGLREELEAARAELTERILKVEEAGYQTLLMLRCVECLSASAAARRLHYSLRTFYKVQAKAREAFEGVGREREKNGAAENLCRGRPKAVITSAIHGTQSISA